MSDALKRLQQRQRPKVAPRDASLTPKPLDIQTSRHTDIQTSETLDTSSSSPVHPEVETPREQDIQTSRHTDSANSRAQPDFNTPVVPDTLKSRHTEAKTHKSLDDELQTKRSTFRLEADLIERLHTFCRRQGLSREVLIEAMYEFMEAHPEAMDQVVAQAQEKNEYRQQLANRKRAEAMMSKFGGSGS
jgi:hypothetical protein